MQGFCGVLSLLEGTDDRTLRFVENQIRASFRAVAGAPGFTVFDYGVWCIIARVCLYFILYVPVHLGFFSPTLMKCLVANASSFDRLTSEMYV